MPINFNSLMVWFTPVARRKDNFLILIQAAVHPLVLLYQKHLSFKRATLYRLAHNSQVCYLRKVLNDQFDNAQRRIQIVDFSGVTRIYLFSDASRRDVYLGTEYLYDEASYADLGFDFTVQVPATVATSTYDIALLKALLDEYKLVSKNYNIERI